MADARIQDLEPVTEIYDDDKFVLSQTGHARSLTGATLATWLSEMAASIAGGLGSISEITGPEPDATNPLKENYAIHFTGGGEQSYSITNGNYIKSVVVLYGVSNSTTTQPEVWLNTAPQTSAEAKYLWQKLAYNMADNTQVPISTFVCGVYGDTGKSSYTHIRYAENYPESDSDISIDTLNANWMGIAVTESPTAPTEYDSYTWSLIRGSQGVPGNDAPPVKATIKYSANNSSSVHPDVNDSSLWFNQPESVPPSFGDYKWIRTMFMQPNADEPDNPELDILIADMFSVSHIAGGEGTGSLNTVTAFGKVWSAVGDTTENIIATPDDVGAIAAPESANTGDVLTYDNGRWVGAQPASGGVKTVNGVQPAAETGNVELYADAIKLRSGDTTSVYTRLNEAYRVRDTLTVNDANTLYSSNQAGRTTADTLHLPSDVMGQTRVGYLFAFSYPYQYSGSSAFSGTQLFFSESLNTAFYRSFHYMSYRASFSAWRKVPITASDISAIPQPASAENGDVLKYDSETSSWIAGKESEGVQTVNGKGVQDGTSNIQLVPADIFTANNKAFKTKEFYVGEVTINAGAAGTLDIDPNDIQLDGYTPIGIIGYQTTGSRASYAFYYRLLLNQVGLHNIDTSSRTWKVYVTILYCSTELWGGAE